MQKQKKIILKDGVENHKLGFARICVFKSNKGRRACLHREDIIIKRLRVKIATTMLTNSARQMSLLHKNLHNNYVVKYLAVGS